jgi:micrococcal nuclease
MHRYNAKLIRVYDGDTIWVDLDLGFGIWLRNQSIRLKGIDTPEVRGSEKIKGRVSRDRLIELLESAERDSSLTIQTTKDKQKGKYGRILGEVFIENEKRSLNQILLDEGLAVEYMKD